MQLNTDKIDAAVVALLLLGKHDESRAWKGFDWESICAPLGSQFTAIVAGQNLGSPISVNFSGTGVTATVQAGSDSNTLILSVSVALDAASGARSLTVTTESGNVTVLNALVIERAPAVATSPLPIPEVEAGAIRSGYVIVTPDTGRSPPLATLTLGLVGGGIVRSQAATLRRHFCPAFVVAATKVTLRWVGNRPGRDGIAHRENSLADDIPAPAQDPVLDYGALVTSDRSASGFLRGESCT